MLRSPNPAEQLSRGASVYSWGEAMRVNGKPSPVAQRTLRKASLGVRKAVDAVQVANSLRAPRVRED